MNRIAQIIATVGRIYRNADVTAWVLRDQDGYAAGAAGTWDYAVADLRDAHAKGFTRFSIGPADDWTPDAA